MLETLLSETPLAADREPSQAARRRPSPSLRAAGSTEILCLASVRRPATARPAAKSFRCRPSEYWLVPVDWQPAASRWWAARLRPAVPNSRPRVRLERSPGIAAPVDTAGRRAGTGQPGTGTARPAVDLLHNRERPGPRRPWRWVRWAARSRTVQSRLAAGD